MALKPAGLDHLHAACIGVAGLTAWQALFRHGELHTSKRVLVHGGGGGVGHLVLQFATGHGAQVITTVSTEDLDFASSLGAAEVIDYKAQRFEEVVGDVDLVIDLIGGATRQRSWQVMKPGGILVSTLGQPEAPASAPVGVRGREIIVECHNEQMLEIAFQAADGLIRIEVDRVFPLEQVEQAHEHLENEHSRGKTVLEVLS
jgi:NADPH:quinone reductase-like Zn-dependent oxidoreductase